MEITKPEAVNEELIAKSKTRSLDELRRRGAEQVKTIRASDIAAMISETVNRVLVDSNALSDEDVEILVQKGTKEFKRVFRERQLERQRAEQKYRDMQDELHAANARIRELEAMLGSGEAGAAAPNAELMMRMMTEMADMKAELAQAQNPGAGAQPQAAGAPGASLDGLTQALDQISENLNSRLEQFGKKMGISSAVEASEVKYDTLFDSDDDASIESNMGDVEVKKKSGGGIAGNLARLKKMKGDS